jgi:hypothetical protein
MAGVGILTATSVRVEFSFPSRFAKMIFGSSFENNRRDACSPFSGVFENQGAAVGQLDFRCLPRRALIEAVRVWIGWIPATVEPVEVGFVVGDPLFNPRIRSWKEDEGRNWGQVTADGLA